ncbi:MAG: aminotransferase class III-fold pyridoxal phosphate-dependent enzyme [Candidatus Sungbacteria bacterium]|nr:aminotransferase class III-fold pyridoxal phosphate-dependent enzyme [Candidatus Sungbacteria bacterium]
MEQPFDERRFLERYWHFSMPDTILKTDRTIFTHARGCELFNQFNRRWLDFCAQVGIANIGHHHPFFVRAWFEYMRMIFEEICLYDRPAPVWTMIASDFHFRFEIKVEGETLEISHGALEEMLSRHTFGPSTKFIKGLSGADSNSDSVKFVQKLTHKPYGIAFYGAFHGRLGSALDATMSKAVQREGFFIPSITHHLLFPQTHEEFDYDLQILNYLPLSDYGFVMYEAVQGEGGINPAHYYTIELLKCLREKGLLLVCDDVQTGFGRTGMWFGYQNLGVVPDIVTISKSMGSGDPIGAAFFDGANPRLAGWEKFEPGWDSSTFQWNPHAVLSAIATIRAIERENLVERARLMGNYLERAIDYALVKSFPDGDLSVGGYCKHKGIGLHRGLEFRKKFSDGRDVPDPKTRDAVLALLFENGIVTLGAGNRDVNPTIRFMPPLVVTEKEIDEFLHALESALVHTRHSTK